MSQVLHHYHPRLVDLHNYTPTLSASAKRSNWATLNAKVLRRLRCPVSAEDVERVITGEKGAIERVLWGVYGRVGEWEEAKAGRKGGELSGVDEGELVMAADGSIYPWPTSAPQDGRPKADGHEGSAREQLTKDRLIADQRDTIEVAAQRPVRPRGCFCAIHRTARSHAALCAALPAEHRCCRRR